MKCTAGIHFIRTVCVHQVSCPATVLYTLHTKTTFSFHLHEFRNNLISTYCTVMLLMSMGLWGWGGWQPSLQFRRWRHEDGHRRGRSRRPKLAFNQTQCYVHYVHLFTSQSSVPRGIQLNVSPHPPVLCTTVPAAVASVEHALHGEVTVTLGQLAELLIHSQTCEHRRHERGAAVTWRLTLPSPVWSHPRKILWSWSWPTSARTSGQPSCTKSSRWR